MGSEKNVFFFESSGACVPLEYYDFPLIYILGSGDSVAPHNAKPIKDEKGRKKSNKNAKI